MSTSARRTSIVLVALLLAGAALRFVGLGFGFPQVGARPDELDIVVVALRAAGGHFDPVYFNYPSLFMYVSGALDFFYCGARVSAGVFPSVAVCADPAREGWEPFFLIARSLSALSGVVAIALVFVLARRFGRDAREGTVAGLTAALLLAVNVLHVRDSHFAVTDVSMTTGVLAALVLLCRAHERPSWRRFLVAGLAAGAATSLKYNAVLLGAPVLASQGMAVVDAIRNRRRPDFRALVFAVGAGFAFFAGTPYALIRRQAFERDLTFEARHLRAGHDGIVGQIGWIHHLLVTLPAAAGWLLMAMAVGGALWAAWRNRRLALLVFAFPVVYYAVAGQGYTVFARYMVPMIPFLCIGGALMTIALRRIGAAGAVAGAAIVAVIAGTHVSEAAALDRLLQQTDSRVLATAWVWSTIPEHASVYLTGSVYARPQLHRPRQRAAYDVWTWDYGRHRFKGPAGERGEWPEWIMVLDSPLVAYDSVPPEIIAGLVNYELRQRINAVADVPHVYDQQDGWYLPLDGFSGVVRPGPTVSIYRRRN